jgi:molecular chaperone GrpE (heat shock protein)
MKVFSVIFITAIAVTISLTHSFSVKHGSLRVIRTSRGLLPYRNELLRSFRLFSATDPESESTTVENEEVEEQEAGEEGDETEATEGKIESKELSPYEKAVHDLESKLRTEVVNLESLLKVERVSLSKLKDKVSESGKTGFFMVQAQVADFQKKKDIEQKARVERNKKEFVQKMLPVVDAFREARELAPPATEREENMHKNFGSLLSGILTVFEKYGYQEFDAGMLWPMK